MNILPSIHTKTIQAKHMRYPTAGDYLDSGVAWHIRVARMDDWRHTALVLVHELVEMITTKHQGIDWKDIDDWDTIGGGKDSDDPGSLPDAPYHDAHMFAESLERQLAEKLGIDWNDYNTALDSLEYKEK